MSQYPNPYQQPSAPPGGPAQPMGYGGYPQMPFDGLAPARRASLTMIILGSLALMAGLCMGAMSRMPLEQVAAQQGQRLPPLPQGMTWGHLFMLAAIMFLVGGVAEVAVGIFVRRGGAVASIIGIVLSVLGILYFAFNAVVGGTMGGAGAGGPCFSVILIGCLVLQLVFLIQARGASSQIKQMQGAYQAQYWQYMQQMQANQAAYNAGAYGQGTYNAPAAPPPQPGASQTGWQWQAPPPPPPASTSAPFPPPPSPPPGPSDEPPRNPPASGAP